MWWARLLRCLGALRYNHVAIFFSDGVKTERYEEFASGFKRAHEWPKCYKRMLLYHPALLEPQAAIEALGWCKGKLNTPYGWLDLFSVAWRWAKLAIEALLNWQRPDIKAYELGLTCSAVCSQVATELLLNFGVDIWGTKWTMPDDFFHALKWDVLHRIPNTEPWPPHISEEE